MFSCIYDDIESAGNVMTSFTGCLIYGCGVYVNLKTAPWYIKFLGWISPFRYVIENLMRTMLSGLPAYNNNDILDNYDYHYHEKTIPIGIGFFVFFFFISWFAIIRKAKEL